MDLRSCSYFDMNPFPSRKHIVVQPSILEAYIRRMEEEKTDQPIWNSEGRKCHDFNHAHHVHDYASVWLARPQFPVVSTIYHPRDILTAEYVDLIDEDIEEKKQEMLDAAHSEYGKFAIAYALTLASGPVRLAFTLVATPWLARQITRLNHPILNKLLGHNEWIEKLFISPFSVFRRSNK